VVKRHVEDGAEIVSVMEAPEITATVRHHHERFDGHGYPDGLVGQQTPVAARIIAVADTFDALTSIRPYRAALPHQKALAIIVAASGTQLDPVPVRAFLRCYSGRRWVLFWTLLAASPQRAFGAATGSRAGRANLTSSTTIIAPPTLAAVVAAVIGSAGSVAPAHALQLAQRPTPPARSSGSTAGRSRGHPGATGHASGSASSASSPDREVALRITRPHRVARASSGGASSYPDPARLRLPDQHPRRGTPSRPGRKPPPPSVVELPPVAVPPRQPVPTAPVVVPPRRPLPTPAPPPTPNPVASSTGSPPPAYAGPRGDAQGQNNDAQGQKNDAQGQNNNAQGQNKNAQGQNNNAQGQNNGA
jgi:hypothetical protein